MTTYPKSLTVQGHRLGCTVETRRDHSSRSQLVGYSLLVFLTARCTRDWRVWWGNWAVIRAARDRVDMLGLDAFEIYAPAPATETGTQTGRIFRRGRQWDLVCEGEKT